MSSIDEIIAKMQKEDELRRQETERLFAEQEKKYAAMYEKLTRCKEQSENQIDSIVKNLDQLNANKHTIEKALEQTENLPGLPVPHEHHKSVIDLFSTIAGFVNKADTLMKKNSFSPQQVQSNSVSATESVLNDFKDCKTEVFQAESLLTKAKELKKLIDESNAYDEIVEQQNHHHDGDLHDGSFLNNDKC